MTYDVILFTDSFPGLWRVRSLGAYRLATELRKHGYSVKVVDWCCKIFKDYRTARSILKSLVGPNTLFVGYSSTHFYKTRVGTESFNHESDYYFDEGNSPHTYPASDKIFSMLSKETKKFNPSTKIVYGGAYADGYKENKLLPCIDYIIKGFSDSTIVELANHLRHGDSLKFLPGSYPGQKVIAHDELGLSFNFPNSYTEYLPEDHIRQGEVLYLETSRGCMFKCSFCNFKLIGRKSTDPKYHKEISVLADELKRNWETYQVNRYIIVDDTFNESTQKLLDIQSAIQMSGVPDLKFFAYLRLDLVKKNPEQIQLLKDMGIQAAYFGIESLNDLTLKTVRKPMKGKDVKKFLEELRLAWPDVGMHGSILFGLPHETVATITDWMKWITALECPLDSVMVMNLNIGAYDSVFGLDPAKHGYEVIKLPGDINRFFWKTEHLDSGIIAEMRLKYHNDMLYSRRSRTNAYELLGAQNQGWKFEELFLQPYLDQNRLEKSNRIIKQYNEYIKELCKYEGITL